MSPAETAAILRQFNEWRRGDEDIPQFDPREIGEAIDAAVDMIERLEAAEKDVALKERVIDALGSELNAVANERDALRAKVEAMERQEPVALVKWQVGGPVVHLIGDARPGDLLCALPGAKVGEPAHSVPDVDALAQFIREIDGKHQLGAGALAERIVEWLAAAPEAKP